MEKIRFIIILNVINVKGSGIDMKYGVKLTAIDVMDYDDLNEICKAIKKLGYKITFVDNGNVVCEKEVKDGR